MKRVALALFVAPLVAVGIACGVSTVDLGVDEIVDAAPDVVTPVPEAAPPDAPEPTFEERLRARCVAPPGAAARYGSARELTALIVGSWYLCDEPATSPLLLPSGVTFRSDATWSILVFDATRTALVPWPDNPDKGGTFEYYAFSDPEAGAGADGGGGSRFVPIHDPAPRGGLFVYLHRGVSDDIVVQLELETPGRMLVRNVGPSQLRAFYVAVP